MSIIDQYETVIWDWNGTLLNDVWLCVEIVNQLLVNHNDRQLDETQYRDVFGFPITSYYERIGIDMGKEPFELLTEKFISSYDSKVKICEMHDRALDTLNFFRQNDLAQFILTAAYKESVLHLLDHYDIKAYFKKVEGLDNHRAESKVERGRQLIKQNQISTVKTILIGDTLHDYEVANEIGVDCVLIANGHQSKERLAETTTGQIKILDHIGQLIKY